MKLIINPFRDCYHNIASEEFLCDNFNDEIFLLYINKPSIIIGRNQNAYSEINNKFVSDNNIDLVRRLSGGGAVYHDENNLNFSFIMNKSNKSPHELFKEFTKPIINALNKLGLDAKFTGRNDLTIDDKKFSGNAQFHKKNRTAVHGTILFNSDLSILSKALEASEIKYVDKGIKSVRSRVTNIKPYMKEEFSMEEFVEKIIINVEEQFEKFDKYEYTQKDLNMIDKLVNEKYNNSDWNFGKSPDFKFTTKFKYNKGIVDVNINAISCTINEVKIFGDFFGINSNIEDVEKALLNSKFNPNSMKEALKNIDINSYMDGLTSDKLIDYIFESE